MRQSSKTAVCPVRSRCLGKAQRVWREVRTLRLLASEATLDLGAQRGRKPGSQHGQKAIYHLATEAEARKARHHQCVVAPERDLSAESRAERRGGAAGAAAHRKVDRKDRDEA